MELIRNHLFAIHCGSEWLFFLSSIICVVKMPSIIICWQDKQIPSKKLFFPFYIKITDKLFGGNKQTVQGHLARNSIFLALQYFTLKSYNISGSRVACNYRFIKCCLNQNCLVFGLQKKYSFCNQTVGKNLGILVFLDIIFD